MTEHDEATAPGSQAQHAAVAIPPARAAGNAPDVRLSPGELWEQQNDEASEALNELAKTVTQREWLLITGKLDRTRAEIGSDSGLLMLALAWVKEKHEHGGASWDKLLELTDSQLEELHGFPSGSREDAEKAAAEKA